MKLRDDTAAACVDGWSVGRQTAWTDADRATLRAALIALSDAATPHVLEDAPLADADAQRMLLQRAVAAIEDALTQAAAGMRRALRVGPSVRATNGAPALGLRSARIDDLDALPGVGTERARDLARALAHGGIDRIEQLDAVDGVGPAMRDTLRAHAYFDAPWSALVSPSLLAFCAEPGLARALSLFERSDLELFHGDANRLLRQPPEGGSTVARLLRLLETVRDELDRKRSPLSGALASQGARALAREDLRTRYLAAMEATDGAVLVDAAYRDAMLDAIANAAQSLDLAMFVATASRDRESGLGSEDIIEALEARATAGVPVRVILDRDRPEDPYKSKRINARVIARLRAAGAAVKEDRRDMLLHSKYLVADRKRVIVGSHNLTTSSIVHTHELSVRLDSDPVAASFANRFDALWAALP